MTIETFAYARAGLLGNPSDGYNGKTTSIIVKNFSARVKLTESKILKITPQQQDLNEFESLDDLSEKIALHGYYGGERLIKAAIKKFHEYCNSNGIKLERKNFTIEYASTIPRQIGLAGSSAIVTACMRALLQFYDVAIPRHILPTLILNAELKELGINAGLQDRVIQTYEGCVFMDFDKEFLDKNGYGIYEPLSIGLLPPVYIAYSTKLSKVSGRVLNDIRVKYDRGDRHVIKTLNRIAAITEQGKEALQRGDSQSLHQLINENFDLRSKIMNISGRNKELVGTARACGVSAKFAGSGGSIIGTYKSEAILEELRLAMKKIDAEVIIPKLV